MITDAVMAFSGNNPARAVANIHTAMKIFEVVIMFPFMSWIVKLTYMCVPGTDVKDGEEKYELKYIGKKIISPTTAVIDAINEIEHMGELAIANLKAGIEAICTLNEERIEEVYKTERYINFLNKKITDYLVEVNSLHFPINDEHMIGGLFHVVNDIERIGDHAENFAESAKLRIEDKVEFSDKAIAELQEMTDKVAKILEYSLDMFSHDNHEHMNDILELEETIDEEEKKMQRKHIKRLTLNKCTPEAGMVFSDTASGLERIADHATNIAFSITKPEEVTLLIDEEM
jgi:phosphate:Na+ symporter